MGRSVSLTSRSSTAFVKELSVDSSILYSKISFPAVLADLTEISQVNNYNYVGWTFYESGGD